MAILLQQMASPRQSNRTIRKLNLLELEDPSNYHPMETVPVTDHAQVRMFFFNFLASDA